MERVKKAIKKVAAKYKKAIENGPFKRLPGPVIPPAGVRSHGQRYKCGGRLKK